MPRVRPARGVRSNGSHFPSAWLRSMRRTPLAKKSRAAIANSARAGLYTPRALVSTAGLATRPGNSTSSIPAEREWTQVAPAARSHTDSRAARRIEQTKTASGAGAPAKSSRAAPRTKVTPAGAGSSTCRPGSRGEASTQTVTGRMAPDGTTELGSKAHRRGCEDDHRPRGPDPPPARASRDADDLGEPRVPPLGGGGGGAPAAGPGRARDRHLRRPGLRRPRPVHDAGRAAGLGAAPAVAVPLPRSERAHLRPPESLEHFLVERYLLYAFAGGTLFAGRVHHGPYPLQAANVDGLDESLFAACGVARPASAPLAHYARGVEVDVFPLQRAT